MGAEAFDFNEADRGFGARLTRKEQAIEVLVFLSLIVPTMILAYFVTEQGGGNFTILAWATIIRDLALIALILFFIWRNGESTEQIGWTWRHEWADLGLGVVLFFPMLVLISLLETALRRLGLSGPSPGAIDALTPQTQGQFLLAVFLVIVVAIAEEFIFRGYLIRRLTPTLGRVGLAVVVAAAIFSLGHGYQGTAGLLTIFVVGLIFGGIFVWRKSLAAPVVMHLLQNILGIVVLPYLNR